MTFKNSEDEKIQFVLSFFPPDYKKLLKAQLSFLCYNMKTISSLGILIALK